MGSKMGNEQGRCWFYQTADDKGYDIDHHQDDQFNVRKANYGRGDVFRGTLHGDDPAHEVSHRDEEHDVGAGQKRVIENLRQPLEGKIPVDDPHDGAPYHGQHAGLGRSDHPANHTPKNDQGRDYGQYAVSHDTQEHPTRGTFLFRELRRIFGSHEVDTNHQ
jgi:hypothetical protein